MSDSNTQGAPEGAEPAEPAADDAAIQAPAAAPESAPAPEGTSDATPASDVPPAPETASESEFEMGSASTPVSEAATQVELDNPGLEHVEADDILPADESGSPLPSTVVTDGSPTVPLSGPVTIGVPPDSNDGGIRVVAAQGGTPTQYSNFADGESTGFDHPKDEPSNRMQVVPGFSMPPGASIGVPADLADRIDAIIEADQSAVDADQAVLDVDRAQLAEDEAAGSAALAAETQA